MLHVRKLQLARGVAARGFRKADFGIEAMIE
jgi:hypothetical protein